MPPLAPPIRRDILPSAVVTMAILSPALRDILTTTDLADALNVPAPALRLVSLAPSSCLWSKFPLSAVLNICGC